MKKPGYITRKKKSEEQYKRPVFTLLKMHLLRILTLARQKI